jgi:hypothetical protein
VDGNLPKKLPVLVPQPVGKVSKKEQKELARTQRLLNDNAPITRSVTAAFKEKHVRALPPSPPPLTNLGGKRAARVLVCAVSTPSLTCIAALASKRNNSNGASEKRAARRLHQHREAPGAARGFGASLFPQFGCERGTLPFSPTRPHRNKENKEIFSQISEDNIITPQRLTDEARGRKRKASSEAAEAGGETDADVLSAPAPPGTHFSRKSLSPFDRPARANHGTTAQAEVVV